MAEIAEYSLPIRSCREVPMLWLVLQLQILLIKLIS